MGIVARPVAYEHIRVRFDDDVCFIQIYRPDANNTINRGLVEEMARVLDQCEPAVKIIVLEGLPEVFCFGADFKAIETSLDAEGNEGAWGQVQDPEALYDLWFRLAHGPFVTIAHVRGKANAGGIGFVAACDVVLCEEAAVFSLSELLFGLIPACVLPFLIARIGVSRTRYMTLTTQPVSARQAELWGLADACHSDSESLLRRHLLRLGRLSKTGIERYKRYGASLSGFLAASRSKAIEVNREVFSDPGNLQMIARYVRTGQFPWEA